MSDRDTVLDFGCASGEFTIQIEPYVKHITGIDPSKKMIELANQKVQSNQLGKVIFHQTDIFDQKFQSRVKKRYKNGSKK